MGDLDSIVTVIEDKLSQHNKKMKATPVKLTISLSVAKNIMHITQALDRQRGHVIIVGDVGSGRRSCAVVSALLLNYEVYEVRLYSVSRMVSLLFSSSSYSINVDNSRRKLRYFRMERGYKTIDSSVRSSNGKIDISMQFSCFSKSFVLRFYW